MQTLFTEENDFQANTILDGGDGRVPLELTLGGGLVFNSAEIEILKSVRGDAKFISTPEEGATGLLRFEVRWWYDGVLGSAPSAEKGRIKFRVKVMAFLPLVRIRLRHTNGLYLGAMSGGGASMDVRATGDEWRACFVVIDIDQSGFVDGARIHLMAPRGHFVVAEGGGGGDLNANRVLPFAWETFTIKRVSGATTPNLEVGDEVILISQNGRRVRALSSGGADARGDASSSTNFTLSDIWGLNATLPESGLRPAWHLGWRFNYFDNAVRALMQLYRPTAGQIAIFKDGSSIYSRAYGYVNRKRTFPASPLSLMRLASVDKPVTRVAIEIWLRGRRDLNKQTPFFPFLRNQGVNPSGSISDSRLLDITFEQMIKGMSGLQQQMNNGMTPEQHAADVMTRTLEYKPGESSRYPNLEYELLRFALLKERGGREGFLRFLREEVFGPTGSKDVDLSGDHPGRWNPREPRYEGWNEYYPNRALWITASAEALVRLFTRYRIYDGRPVGRDNPLLCGLEIINSSGNAVRRITCGSNAPYTDGAGRVWEADLITDDDNRWSVDLGPRAIAGTTDDELYRTLRVGSFDYTFDLDPDGYRLRLHFIEPDHGAANMRRFNVHVNENTVLWDFDIFNLTRARNSALVRTLGVTVGVDRKLRVAAYANWTGDPTWPQAVGDQYFGGMDGTLAFVRQIFQKDMGPAGDGGALRIVTAAIFNRREGTHMDYIRDILNFSTLIDDAHWP